jgi:thiol-disulfide isomerase/thioredoxin
VRNLGIVLLALVGLFLMVPRLGELAGRPFRPLQRAAGGRLQAGDGFGGGLAIGAGLGVVWAPCAGPILGAVTVLAAQHRIGGEALLLAIAYACGAALPLLGVALLGQRATERLAGVRAHAPTIRRVTGGVLVAAAVLFTTSVPDTLATAAPGYTDVLQKVERTHAVQQRLHDLQAPGSGATSRVAAGVPGGNLRDFGPAPDFTGIQAWLDTPGGKPLTIASLRGRVVLIDFWTYSCINCLRTLPQVTAWDARYRNAGLTIVGVHSPEFAFEHVVSNIRRAIARNHIRYPVAVDNDLATWTAWGNQYWPAEYLIDRAGHVRYASFGEGEYAKTEGVIRELLGESKTTIGPSPAIVPSGDVATPEIYLGAERAAAYVQPPPGDPDPHPYVLPPQVQLNEVALGGTWSSRSERIIAGRGAVLELRFHARHAYVVLAPPAGRTVDVRTTLDGSPSRVLHVGADDLYEASAETGATQDHILQLFLPPGTSAYSFTFG